MLAELGQKFAKDGRAGLKQAAEEGFSAVILSEAKNTCSLSLDADQDIRPGNQSQPTVYIHSLFLPRPSPKGRNVISRR
jgi:hypothetical protein